MFYNKASDHVNLYFCIKRRLNSIINKTKQFRHQIIDMHSVASILQGTQQLLEWNFEDISVWNQIAAVGMPNGFIRLIDLNSLSIINEFQVYQTLPDESAWNKFLESF